MLIFSVLLSITSQIHHYSLLLYHVIWPLTASNPLQYFFYIGQETNYSMHFRNKGKSWEVGADAREMLKLFKSTPKISAWIIRSGGFLKLPWELLEFPGWEAPLQAQSAAAKPAVFGTLLGSCSGAHTCTCICFPSPLETEFPIHFHFPDTTDVALLGKV